MNGGYPLNAYERIKKFLRELWHTFYGKAYIDSSSEIVTHTRKADTSLRTIPRKGSESAYSIKASGQNNQLILVDTKKVDTAVDKRTRPNNPESQAKMDKLTRTHNSEH
jgi:hypothetical protein